MTADRSSQLHVFALGIQDADIDPAQQGTQDLHLDRVGLARPTLGEHDRVRIGKREAIKENRRPRRGIKAVELALRSAVARG